MGPAIPLFTRYFAPLARNDAFDVMPHLGDIPHPFMAGGAIGVMRLPNLAVAISHEQMPQAPPYTCTSFALGSSTRVSTSSIAPSAR